jgi:hypothetical protein
MGADESGSAEVVYTTLAVLVETIAESRPLARHGFGLKFACKR